MPEAVVGCTAVAAGEEDGSGLLPEEERAADEERAVVVERCDSDYESHHRYANPQRLHCP